MRCPTCGSEERSVRNHQHRLAGSWAGEECGADLPRFYCINPWHDEKPSTGPRGIDLMRIGRETARLAADLNDLAAASADAAAHANFESARARWDAAMVALADLNRFVQQAEVER